jgi:prepilin-type N-terminal cleavage/methylation domain-containing protein/prepilin-type processing-associated H-X9-DG protein
MIRNMHSEFPAGRSERFSVPPSRRGLTVIEVLVVLAVMGVLLALLMPAVQSARAQARNLQCQNHLKQLGLAAQNHLAVHRALPMTRTRFRDGSGAVYPSISSHVRLLPYLDQSDLYATIEFDHIGIDFPGQLPDSRKLVPGANTQPANQTALKTTVPVFLCPADVQRIGGNNYRACMGYGPGIFGPKSNALCPDPGNAAGAFVNGRGVRVSEIADGLSHTILFSEQLIGDAQAERYTPWTDAFYYEGNLCSGEEARRQCGRFARADSAHDSFRGTTWLLGSWRQSWYNHVATPNSNIPDCSAGSELMVGGGNGSYAARSYHTGGVNVVMVDGSARFVNEQIDLAVWQAQSSRAGGEAVGDIAASHR